MRRIATASGSRILAAAKRNGPALRHLALALLRVLPRRGGPYRPSARQLRHLALALLRVLGGVSVARAAVAAQDGPIERNAWPTAGWRTASPESRGMDPALLADTDARVRAELPLLSALLVVRGGDLVFEGYYNEQTAETPIDLWSVTKSVTSMAAGIALAEGWLESTGQTLGDLIPNRIPADADPRVADVTIAQLLTMTSGFAWDSRTDFLRLDDAPDWAARTLALPMACDPGACYEYNSGNAHLLSVILQAVTGQTLADYLQPRLFGPLGIARPTWRLSPQGETAGAFGLELTARDMAKLGYLYLNQGVWDGVQIVPAEWVATSTSRQSSGVSVSSGVNLGRAAFGSFWWVKEVAGYPAYFTLGYGSQVIYVVPGLDLVAVAGVAEPVQERQQNPFPIIEGLIVPAALAGPAAGAPEAVAFAAQVATPVPAATPVGGGRLFAPPGERVFPEGIAYQAATGDFVAGSSGDVETGEVSVFLPATPDRVALGLALDDRGRLFVAGGETGFVAVYDVATGRRPAELGRGLAPNTYLNDVAVAPSGDAYVTGSFNPIRWRLPAAVLPGGAGTPAAALIAAVGGALEPYLDLSAAAFAIGPGFNANGIVATPDGRFLLIVQTSTGALYRVDLATGGLIQVDLGGGSLSGGDGMLLDGRTLLVVRAGGITPVTMAADFASGTVGGPFVDPSFASPTTVAGFDGCRLVVNSRFDALQGQPALPFTLSSIPIPAGLAATPVAAASC